MRRGSLKSDGLPNSENTVFANLISLDFDHPDFVQRSFRVSGIDQKMLDEQGNWRVKLEPGVPMSGVTIDAASGMPLPGTRVSVSVEVPRPTGLGWRFDQSVTSGADGKYSLRVPAGELRASAYNAAPGMQDYFCDSRVRRPIRSDEAAEIDFAFTRLRSLSGVLKVEDPNLRRSLTLRIRNGGSADSRYATQRRDGTFIFHAVPPGSYQLVVRSANSSAELCSMDVDVAEDADRTGVEVTVDPATIPAPFPSLRGKLLRPDGTPAVLARVHAHTTGPINRWIEDQYTAADGTFTFRGLDDSVDYELWLTDGSLDLRRFCKG
jgi:hypothetical protein